MVKPHHTAAQTTGPAARQYSVALIAPPFMYNYYSGGTLVEEMNRGLLDGAMKHNLFITNFSDGAEFERMYRKREFRAFDGILVRSGNKRLCLAMQHISRNMPVVFFGQTGGRRGAPYVAPDEQGCVTLAVGHLIDEGFDQIGYIPIFHEESRRCRYEAYRETLARRNIRFRSEYTVGFDRFGKQDSRFFSAYELAIRQRTQQQFLTVIFDSFFHGEYPSAVFCGNDYIANYLLVYARQHGISVPENIAVAGCSNNRAVSDISTKQIITEFAGTLTTIDQNFYDMTYAATRLLSDIIAGRSAKRRNGIVIEPTLIIRTSSLKQSHSNRVMQDSIFKKTVLTHLARCYGDNARIKDLPRAMGLSYQPFLRRFKAVFGMTFIAFVNDFRLEKSAAMLRDTSRSITRIYLDAGYANHQHFNQLFKKKFGMLPRDYRGMAIRN